MIREKRKTSFIELPAVLDFEPQFARQKCFTVYKNATSYNSCEITQVNKEYVKTKSYRSYTLYKEAVSAHVV